ncbi:MAG: hypothetical protein IPP82_11785 [Xanthomonadales bacterium]|nr:hypothetical protein [Xanthomonadales bacterium]
MLDQTPANETRYRAQFIVDASAHVDRSNRNVIGFQCLVVPRAGWRSDDWCLAFLPGMAPEHLLRMLVGDTLSPASIKTVDVCSSESGWGKPGRNRSPVGSAGTMKYWVSNVSATTTDGSPTGTVSSLSNAAWTGVDQATLGLVNANTFYRQNFTNTSFVYFDQFDSRCQTFIGH